MSRRDRKPKHRHPAAPTGHTTPADREHTARVEAIAAQRLAESREADREAREREAERLAAMTPEQIAREKLAKEGAFRRMAMLAGLMGGGFHAMTSRPPPVLLGACEGARRVGEVTRSRVA